MKKVAENHREKLRNYEKNVGCIFVFRVRYEELKGVNIFMKHSKFLALLLMCAAVLFMAAQAMADSRADSSVSSRVENEKVDAITLMDYNSNNSSVSLTVDNDKDEPSMLKIIAELIWEGLGNIVWAVLGVVAECILWVLNILTFGLVFNVEKCLFNLEMLFEVFWD